MSENNSMGGFISKKKWVREENQHDVLENSAGEICTLMFCVCIAITASSLPQLFLDCVTSSSQTEPDSSYFSPIFEA